MLKNTASQKLIVRAVDVTTGLPKTGDAANLTAYVAKDFGSLTVLTDTSASEIDSTNAKGYYMFDLAQAETNANVLLFTCKSSTANIVVVACPDVVTPADVTLDLTDGVESGLTRRQLERVVFAALGGESTGAGTATEKFRNKADSKDRISATVDSAGNRTSITFDLT